MYGSFGVDDERLESYDTMVLKYATFTLFVPGPDVRRTFRGARGEIRDYESLRAAPDAQLESCVMRTGDLSKTVRDLASHRFSRPGDFSWPHGFRRIMESSTRRHATFVGDLDGVSGSVLLVTERDFTRPPSIYASVLDPATRLKSTSQVLVVHVAEFGDFRDTMRRRTNNVNVSDEDLRMGLRKLRAVASPRARDSRFLAQQGLVSGASLLSINLRGVPKTGDSLGLCRRLSVQVPTEARRRPADRTSRRARSTR